MINYMGARNIGVEGGEEHRRGGRRGRFSVFDCVAGKDGRKETPKMEKAFPQEVLISKGERFTNFLLPQSVLGFTKID